MCTVCVFVVKLTENQVTKLPANGPANKQVNEPVNEPGNESVKEPVKQRKERTSASINQTTRKASKQLASKQQVVNNLYRLV